MGLGRGGPTAGMWGAACGDEAWWRRDGDGVTSPLPQGFEAEPSGDGNVIVTAQGPGKVNAALEGREQDAAAPSSAPQPESGTAPKSQRSPGRWGQQEDRGVQQRSHGPQGPRDSTWGLGAIPPPTWGSGRWPFNRTPVSIRAR